jgi:hypothetical protein
MTAVNDECDDVFRSGSGYTMVFDMSVCPECEEIVSPNLLAAHKLAAHDRTEPIATGACGCVVKRERDIPAVAPCAGCSKMLTRLSEGKPKDLRRYLSHLDAAWQSAFR